MVVMRDGAPVRMPRKSVETFAALVEHSGRVLTKEEIIELVWPGRVVEPANLTQNIAVVRKLLGVEEGHPACIETFAGRGYRMTGPVGVVEKGREEAEEVAEAEPGEERRGSKKWGWVAAGIALTAVGVGIYWGNRSAGKQADFQRTLVARNAGRQYQAAMSPDGKRIAYVWQKSSGDPGEIWIASEGESSPRQLTQAGGNYRSPAWAPEGKRMAYFRLPEGGVELVVRDVDGTAERVVARLHGPRHGTPNRHIDWSADGQWIAYDDSRGVGQPLAIYVVGAGGGEPRRLTEPDPQTLGDVEPKFSPDGGTVTFLRVFHRVHQGLMAVGAGGGTVRELADWGQQVSTQEWTRDGKALVVGTNHTGEFRLWRLPYGAGGAKEKMEYLGIYGAFPLQVSMARAGTAMAYSELKQDFNIWRYEIGSGRWEAVMATEAQDASPVYSPDGKRFCYRSDVSGVEQIWVANADGTGASPVTQGSLRPSVGQWAPDGTRMVFNNSHSGELYVASDAGATWSVKGLGQTGIHPVYSRDGKWIYAGAADAVVRIPAGGGKAEKVFAEAGLSLRVAADGKGLYFVKESGATQLWRGDLETGKMAVAVEGMIPYCSSCFAEEAGTMYYLGEYRQAASKQAIYAKDLRSGTVRMVTAYPEPLIPMGAGPFSLRPGGKDLLCVRVDASRSEVARVAPFTP